MFKWLRSQSINGGVRLKRERSTSLRAVVRRTGAIRSATTAKSAEQKRGRYCWTRRSFFAPDPHLEKLKAYNSSLWMQHLASNSTTSQLDAFNYEEIANNTLEMLAEIFESIADEGPCPDDYDVQLSSGVLTVKIGGDLGTYVINKQSPNRQIWLSSPKSGPKRYDFLSGSWIYSHTGEDLNELLTHEISNALSRSIDFTAMKYTLND